MKYSMWIIVLSCVWSAFLCSCVHTSGGASEGAKPASSDDGPFIHRRKILPDAKTSEYLDVVEIDDKTLPTGKMKGMVSLRNKQDTPFKFSYKFIWFDAKGKELANPSEKWTETDIMGNATKIITAVAPNTKCVDFQVKLMALE